MKYIIIILIVLVFGLIQCTPQYYNCEGYKYSSFNEIPVRCNGYFK